MGGSAPRAHLEVGKAVTAPSALGAMPGQARVYWSAFLSVPPAPSCRSLRAPHLQAGPGRGADLLRRPLVRTRPGDKRTATPRPRARNPMPTWPRSPARPQALTLLRCLSPGRRSHSSRLASEELGTGERVAGFSQ